MELTLLDMERALDDVGVYEDSTHQLLPRHEASGQYCGCSALGVRGSTGDEHSRAVCILI